MKVIKNLRAAWILLTKFHSSEDSVVLDVQLHGHLKPGKPVVWNRVVFEGFIIWVICKFDCSNEIRWKKKNGAGVGEGVGPVNDICSWLQQDYIFFNKECEEDVFEKINGKTFKNNLFLKVIAGSWVLISWLLAGIS